MVISTKEPSLHSKPDKQKQVINKIAGEKQVIYRNASVILRVASLLYLHYNSISIGIRLSAAHSQVNKVFHCVNSSRVLVWF